MDKSKRRLAIETFSLVVSGGELSDGTIAKQHLDVSISYHKGHPCDIIFVGRGKTGHGIDLMFSDLGIQLSRILQGRDPREQLELMPL